MYLLLDDLAGASLIAGFVWIQWRDQLRELGQLRSAVPARTMRGICSGFRPGASTLNPDGTPSRGCCRTTSARWPRGMSRAWWARGWPI